MTSTCVSRGQMQAFLAGQLDPAEEEAVVRHVDDCPRCEQLAAELSDDSEARELAAASSQCARDVVVEPEVQDLCRRLHALGMYESVLDYTDSGFADGPSATAISENP